MAYLRTLGIDEALARTDTISTLFSLADALGSTVALTDATGATPTTYTYAPFGDTAVTGTPSASPFQFTGREHDGTGPYYYRARYSDPGRSRFVNEDPIGLPAGPNLYLYVRGNPVRFRDPLGLMIVECGPWVYYAIIRVMAWTANGLDHSSRFDMTRATAQRTARTGSASRRPSAGREHLGVSARRNGWQHERERLCAEDRGRFRQGGSLMRHPQAAPSPVGPLPVPMVQAALGAGLMAAAGGPKTLHTAGPATGRAEG